MADGLKIQPVIMSGGAGTRLWPLSRNAKPKQFLPLVTDKTMLQETALRFQDAAFSDPVAICGEAHAAHISDQLAAIKIKPGAVITEPMPRNTAAVAAVAAAWTEVNNNSALVLLAPADHHIEDAAAFRRAVIEGSVAANAGEIVTFGIKAATPHTGYGYIKQGAELTRGVFKISTFLEKPTRDTAEQYLAEGGYYWNAGIFLFSPAAMIAELQTHAPEILAQAKAALTEARIENGVTRLDRNAFEQCPSDSIDYAVMERTDRAAVVAPVDVGWNDIGSWTELPNATDETHIAAVDCSNTLIKSDGPFVGAIGLEDMIVVATGDAVLIAPRDRAQEVKTIVERLKQNKRDDLL